jgi:preprotein translocase subunit SecF
LDQPVRSFRLIPDDTRIPFVRYQYWAYAFSGALVLLTLILLPTKGLNFGIDFQGGILIEVGMPGRPISQPCARPCTTLAWAKSRCRSSEDRPMS